MPETDGFPPDVQAQIDKIGGAEIVVGLSTYNDVETVGRAIGALREGLRRYCSPCRAVFVQFDGGSEDGTRERALEAADGQELVQLTHPIHSLDNLHDPLGGVPGRTNAVRMFFLLAEKLGASACAVVGSGLGGISPGWVEVLLLPLLKGRFDAVTPCYVRHKFEGTMLNGIVYPFTRALYGKRIRQPLAADFAVSSRVIVQSLEPDVWANEVARWGVEVGIGSQVLWRGYNVGQAVLGTRPRASRETTADLSGILAHVLGGFFTGMARHVTSWQKVRGSRPVPLFGGPFQVSAEAEQVNVKPMIEAFRLGSQDLREIWGAVLPPATLLELSRMARCPDESFRFPDELWARTLYDFALGHRLRVIGRDHLLRALTPLYTGWTASFIQEIRDACAAEVEDRIETLCLAFEAQKPYLISRWRWPDRFNP
jgi:glucosylglycerate synthase